MDKAPLNRAHQLERRAEYLTRQKQIDESVQCYVEAVQLYKKSLETVTEKTSFESISMQKERIERQIKFLQLKKTFTEKQRKFKESCKASPKEAIEKLEERIFKNFESHDSLICYLAQRGVIDANDKTLEATIEETDGQGETSTIIVGKKRPKDDTTVIEELKELSGQLRESVQDLLIQLDERNREIEQLKNQIKDIEMNKSNHQEDTNNVEEKSNVVEKV